jgi:hypothetical protein
LSPIPIRCRHCDLAVGLARMADRRSQPVSQQSDGMRQSPSGRRSRRLQGAEGRRGNSYREQRGVAFGPVSP